MTYFVRSKAGLKTEKKQIPRGNDRKKTKSKSSGGDEIRGQRIVWG